MEGKKKGYVECWGWGGLWGGVWKVFPFYFIHQNAYGDVFRVNLGSQEVRVDIILHPPKKKKLQLRRTDEPQLTRGTLVRVDMLKIFQPKYNKQSKVLSI
jgi:hypothetical protein